jgi:hypothetical protein
MTAKALTKKGPHGTLYRYCIAYDDDGHYPIGSWHAWAYSMEHALELFDDGDDGFRALTIARMTDRPKHEWIRHEVAK